MELLDFGETFNYYCTKLVFVPNKNCDGCFFSQKNCSDIECDDNKGVSGIFKEVDDEYADPYNIQIHIGDIVSVNNKKFKVIFKTSDTGCNSCAVYSEVQDNCPFECKSTMVFTKYVETGTHQVVYKVTCPYCHYEETTRLVKSTMICDNCNEKFRLDSEAN
jgi:ribosomal protein L37AE/L43A